MSLKGRNLQLDPQVNMRRKGDSTKHYTLSLQSRGKDDSVS
jgi:hypothetical protein